MSSSSASQSADKAAKPRASDSPSSSTSSTPASSPSGASHPTLVVSANEGEEKAATSTPSASSCVAALSTPSASGSVAALSPGTAASAALASFYDLPPPYSVAINSPSLPSPSSAVSPPPQPSPASAAAASATTAPASPSTPSSAPHLAAATTPTATADGDTSPAAAAGTVEQKPALTAEQQVVKDIMGRFAEHHTDLSRNPHRMLIKEGQLARQATFKTVERTIFLFNDCLVVTDVVQKGEQQGRLIQKQVLDLRAIVVEDPASSAGKKRSSSSSALSFDVLTPQRDFHFIAPSVQAKAEWMRATRDAASAHKLIGSSSSSIVEEGAVQGKEVFGLSADGDGGDQSRLLTATVHSAVREGQDDILLHLLSEREEDANQRDPDGHTAVHVAVESGNAFALSLLIAHGADLAAVDAHGNTPLHLACKRSDYGTVMMLLSKGADVRALDAEGNSPLWLLCDNVKEPSSAAAGEGGDGGEEGQQQVSVAQNEKGVVEIVSMLVEAGSDVEEQRAGEPLLLHLCKIGAWKAVVALCACKVNVGHMDAQGRTALHLVALLSSTPSSAMLQSYLRIAKALVSHGAPPNARDHQLNAPLHLTQSLAMAGCLLVNGARVELRNSQGKRAAEWLEQKSSWDSEAAWLQAKESMRDAQQAWTERPETTLEEGGSVTEEADWLDTGLDVCMLCGSEFSLTRRRHHCRRCGILVDAQCSSKTFRAPSSTSSERCCDGCYNVMVERAVETERRQRDVRKKEKTEERRRATERKERDEADRREAEERARRIRESEERIKASQERVTVKQAAFEQKKQADRVRDGQEAREQKDDLRSSMQSNRSLLEDRGNRLNEMADRSDRLQDEAQNFADMAKKLKEREKAKSWFGFG